MARFYGILAVLGWTWTVLFFVWLAVRLRRERSSQKGFDVVQQHEKHL
jgi:hypothetical protein